MGCHLCEYHMYSVWQADVSSMFFPCHFDMKVPEARRLEVCDLLAHANERLWLGHFDLMAEEGAVMFRHTIPLRGLTGASVEQLEDLVEAALLERSEERRVGKECVSTCRSRGWPCHTKKN